MVKLINGIAKPLEVKGWIFLCSGCFICLFEHQFQKYFKNYVVVWKLLLYDLIAGEIKLKYVYVKDLLK